MVVGLICCRAASGLVLVSFHPHIKAGRSSLERARLLAYVEPRLRITGDILSGSVFGNVFHHQFLLAIALRTPCFSVKQSSIAISFILSNTFLHFILRITGLWYSLQKRMFMQCDKDAAVGSAGFPMNQVGIDSGVERGAS